MFSTNCGGTKVATATYTDEEVARIEAARDAGGPVAEQAMEDQIKAERAEAEARAAADDAEFDAAAPTRADIDAAHAEQAEATGEPSDVPGVEPAAAGLDPEPLDEGRYTLNAGGKRPTSASMVLQGGKIEYPTELRKGSKVRVVFECRVGGVHFDDKIDSKTGRVVACERKQVLKPIAPAQLEKL